LVIGGFIPVLVLLVLISAVIAKAISIQFNKLVIMFKNASLNKDKKLPFDRIFIHELKMIGYSIMHAEDALYEANTIINRSLAVAFLWKNEKGWPVEFVSENVKKLFGYSSTDFISGKITYAETIHKDDIENVTQEVTLHSNQVNKHSFMHEPYRIITKNGDVKWVADTTYIRRDVSGKITHYEGIVNDITERKQAEENLKSISEIVEQSTEGMALADLEGNLLFVNKAWVEMHGYKYSKDCLGKNLKIFHSREQFKNDVIPFNKEVKKYGTYSGEVGHITKEGKSFPTLMTTTLLKDEKGNPYAIAGIAQDITERKETEKELRKYRYHLEELVKERTTKLEEANKELEAFSYSISHDLRAPLRAIDGFTRILVEDYASKLDNEGKRIGSVIQDNATKMGKLIDDLLAFSRMGRTAMSFSNIDMKNMVNAIYHEATSAEERKRIKFTVGDLPAINGDTSMMRQVWMNLISNAVKFSSNRKQAIIDVSSKEEKDKITYSVKDNGTGFNMKYVDKLFRVFNRLHSEKDFEGTGVGLALVQGIVNRHGGNIWAEGEMDNGATLFFSLPIKKVIENEV
ncbi:MAG: PAS domain S-box protein, partial [Candidatus Marinimicrobia bacterium]|nr:PAS domain S-box protein [Candidatus Neomarinimicrobiota bacterium]